MSVIANAERTSFERVPKCPPFELQTLQQRETGKRRPARGQGRGRDRAMALPTGDERRGREGFPTGPASAMSWASPAVLPHTQSPEQSLASFLGSVRSAQGQAPASAQNRESPSGSASSTVPSNLSPEQLGAQGGMSTLEKPRASLQQARTSQAVGGGIGGGLEPRLQQQLEAELMEARSKAGVQGGLSGSKYVGTVRVVVPQLIESLHLGLHTMLTVQHSSTPSGRELSVLLDENPPQTVAVVPTSVAEWLSILLDVGKVVVVPRASTFRLDNGNVELHLFLHVTIDVQAFQRDRSMDLREKGAWARLYDMANARVPISSAKSVPVLPPQERQSSVATDLGSAFGQGVMQQQHMQQGGQQRMMQQQIQQVQQLHGMSVSAGQGSLAAALALRRGLKRSRTDTVLPNGPPMKKIPGGIETPSHNAMRGAASSLAAAVAEEDATLGADALIKRLFQHAQKSSDREMDPSPLLQCTLRPYQRQALAWLVERETPTIGTSAPASDSEREHSLPPCWTEYATDCGRKYYYNTLTKTTTWEYPMGDSPLLKIGHKPSVLGGILADEMGMGKTVEMLSLVLTNTPGVGKIPATDRDDPCATLIVCPLSVMAQWTSEIEKYTPTGSVSFYVFHGAQRRREPEFLAGHDFVLTTYATLASEVPNKREASRGTGGSEERKALLAVKWLRVILDEAHMIKDRTTRTAKAAFRLKAERRWCVTGTPIQNKLDDLFSLLHFLKVRSYGDYQWWQQVIMRPIRNREERGFTRLQQALEVVLLRRTKGQRTRNDAPIVSLPPRLTRVRRIPFMAEEEDFYKALWDKAKTRFARFVAVGTVLHNYAHILELLLRLRQACDHPQLVVASRQRLGQKKTPQVQESTVRETQAAINCNNDEDAVMEGQEKESMEEGEEEEITAEEAECMLCMEAMDMPLLSACGHHFCRECIERYVANELHAMQGAGEVACPTCGSDLLPDELKPLAKTDTVSARAHHCKSSPAEDESAPLHEDVVMEESPSGVWSSSSKLDALMQELVVLHRNEPQSKAIVFSQWTSMLDLVEGPLRTAGVRFVRLDGSMVQQHRESAVKQFREEADVKVFLISMKAGGLGLNLVAANHVFLLDPWWNPATEQQAIDRVHRLGQKKPVVITRFIIANTIEERILELQSKKRQLVQGALGTRELKRMREEELSMLFSE